jgi:hypothetical protein
MNPYARTAADRGPAARATLRGVLSTAPRICELCLIFRGPLHFMGELAHSVATNVIQAVSRDPYFLKDNGQFEV